MNKMTKLWLRCILLGLFGVLLSVVWPPTIAEAHNCGDFLDCYDTLRAAVSATVGLTTFAVILSVGLDFVPGVGQGKGIIEAATGRDLITGEELKTHERLLGILGPAGRIADMGSTALRGMARGGRHADSGSDVAKGTRQADTGTGAGSSGSGGQTATGGSQPRSGGRQGDSGTGAGSSGRGGGTDTGGSPTRSGGQDGRQSPDKGTGNVIPTKSINDLPSNVQNSYNKYSQSGWNGNVAGQTQGTKAGGKWQNSNRQLPKTDSAGNPITYREFDVNNKLPNSTRDTERFIVGSDGSIYYTNSHYGDIPSPTGLPDFVRLN